MKKNSPSAPEAELSRTINNRYRLIRRLGKGGMGEVYLVEDRHASPPQQIALKTLQLDGDLQKDVLSWFKSEFHALAGLRHPGIAGVFDFSRDGAGGSLFFTSEYVDGEDIFAASRRMNLTEQIRLAGRVVEALAYIHGKGLLHNDLKSSNILVERKTGQPKIIDFGISTGAPALHQGPEGFRGTYAYAAPEVLQGEPATSHADLYSLGMVFYKMFTGRMPYDAKNSAEILRQCRTGNFLPPRSHNPELPLELSTVVHRLLAREPQGRPADAQELRRELNTVLTLVSGEASGDLPSTAFSLEVKRDKEMSLLKHFVEQKLSSSVAGAEIGGAAVFASVEGAAGAGKSTLLRRLKHAFQLKDITVISASGRGSELFSLWKGVAAELSSFLTQPEGLQIYRPLLEFLRDPSSKSASFFSYADRAGFFAHMRGYLEAAFSQSPFVLFIDDVEECDSFSLDFLRALLECTPSEKGPAFPIILGQSGAAFAPAAPSLTVKLEPLLPTEINETLQGAFPGLALSEERLGELHRHSAGQLEVLERIIRKVLEQGLLKREDGFWNWESTHPLSGDEQTLAERLACEWRDLSSMGRQILGLLATERGFVSGAEISGALDLPEKELRTTLENLSRHHLVAAGPVADTWFVSRDVQAVLENQIHRQERQLLHARWVEILEKQTHPPFERLAHHCQWADRLQAAATYWLAAADHAEKLFAYESAASLFEKALQCSVGSDDGRLLEARAIAGLARMTWLAGDRAKAIDFHERLLTHPSSAERPELRFEAYRAQAIFLRGRGEYARAREILQRGIGDLAKETESAAVLTAELSLTCQMEGRLDESAGWSEKALSLVFRRGRYAKSALPTLLLVATVHADSGQAAKAEPLYRAVLELTEKDGQRERAAALNSLAALKSRQGKYRHAAELLQESLELCRNMKDAARLCRCLDTLGKVEYASGHLSEAAEALNEALVLARALGDQNLLATILNALGRLEIDRGYWQTSKALLQEAKDLYRHLHLPEGSERAELSQRVLDLHLGRLETVRAHLSKRSPGHPLSVEVEVRAGAFERALELLRPTQSDETPELALLRVRVLTACGKEAAAALELERLRESKQLDEHHLVSVEAQILALALELKTSPAREILPRVRNAIRQAERLGSPLLALRAQEILAVALEKDAKTIEARDTWRAIEETYEKLTHGLTPDDIQEFWAQAPVQKVRLELARLSQESGVLREDLHRAAVIQQKFLALSRIQRALAASWENPDHRVRYVLDTVLEVLDLQHGALLLYDEDSTKPRAVLCSRAERSGWRMESGAEKGVTIDLNSRGRKLGALYLALPEDRSPVGPGEKDLLQACTDQCLAIVAQDRQERSLRGNLEETTSHLQALMTAGSRSSENLEWKYRYSRMIGGRSPEMAKVFRLLDRVIPYHANILIQGESGTGKELVAKSIHENGPRKEKPFLELNCGTLNPNLLESELFGHRKGSFTGAEADRIGLLALANGGTVFLDEVSDMPKEVQSKLLRAIQEGEIRAVGSDKTQKIDVRIIAASNKLLSEQVTRGEFREDLYYRLNVVQIDLPALRARMEDLDLLVDFFLEELGKKKDGRSRTLTAQARKVLRGYPWPGNVRELRNSLEALIATHSSRRLDAKHLPATLRDRPAEKNALRSFEAAREEFLKHYIQELLVSTHGKITHAADISGLSRQYIHRVMKKHHLGG